jgi:O-antigen ligase
MLADETTRYVAQSIRHTTDSVSQKMATWSLREWFSQAIEILWLAAAIAVPLAFNPWGYSGFELPKAALLRALILLMGLVVLMRLVEGRSAPRRCALSPLVLPTLMFGLVLTLATAFSINPRVSAFGSYERQQGLLTIGANIALLLFVATNLRTRAQMERLWHVLVWGSPPIVAYGFLQAVHLDPLAWRTDAASPVLSTVGRANFLGSYLVLVIPLTAGLLWLARSRLLYLFLLASQLTCLALTQARGAWIGVGAAALVFGLAWSIAIRNWRAALLTLAPAALAIGLLVLLNSSNSMLAPLARVPGLDRLATLTRTDAGATAARLTIWQHTLPLIIARPWLGYGPETMRTVFARVFPPQLVYYQGRHVTVDRAHNVWLDLGMSAGLAGVVTFTLILIAFTRLAWQRLRSVSADWERVAWIALASVIVGHLADLQFGFALTTSATIFWLVLAMAAALGHIHIVEPSTTMERKSDTVVQPNVLSLLPHLFPALVMLALIGLLCVHPLLADVAYWRSQQSTHSPSERLAAAREAVRLSPLEPEYRVGLSWILLQSGDPTAAETQLAAADQLSPNDPPIWAARGTLYAVWGAMEPNRFSQAEAAYRRTLELAPNVAAFHTALGLVLARQGRLEEAVVELERAVALDATDSVAYQHLADLYLALGRESEAAWARWQAARWAAEGGGGRR